MDSKQTEHAITRLKRFMHRIEGRFTPQSLALEAEFAWSKDPVNFDRRLELSYRPASEGEIWGQAWDSAWFHLKGRVPKSWGGKKVVARLDFSGEGLVFSPDGGILQGITTRSIWDANFIRDIVPLFDRSAGGEEVELWVEAAANSLFGVFTEFDPAPDSPMRYGQFEAKVTSIKLCTFDEELWALWLDLKVLNGLIQVLPEKGVRRARIVCIANETIDAWDETPEGTRRSREILRPLMEKPAQPSDLGVTAVGHAHIDTAWLWPVRETIRKCGRTFASQIALIRRYPDYVFGASQPQHYAFVKERYPGLYEKIKQAVAAGRWELQGGMWVEADCNLISGESMIRQILHGKNFFHDEFGIEVDNLWLPDVFGYSAAMPQILRRSGIRYFLTQKLSWNQYNEFPYQTFKWRGIDGSEVLCHFPPENTYNALMDSDSLVKGQENFKERSFIDEFLCLFGIGDGGGGPKEEMIELGLRQKNLEGSPRVTFGTARDFFHRLDQYQKDLPSWVGELYMEGHRGTLTTQAKVKQTNRKLEFRLREIEMLQSLLPLDQYPAVTLDGIWKKLLLNQFHDIIPGSSIHATYEVTHREHQELLEQCRSLTDSAASKLFQPDDRCLVLFNSLSYPWDGLVHLPSSWVGSGIMDSNGHTVPVRSGDDGAFAHVGVEPFAFVTLKKAAADPAQEISGAGLVLENDLVRYEFNRNGELVAAFDKEACRNILEQGQPGNVLTLYDDHPNDWDAWDIDLAYEKQALGTAVSVKVSALATGPVQQRLAFTTRIGTGVSIRQVVTLACNSKRLDFQTTVTDWREKHRMLRVSFPVNVQSDQASFDIQYGYLKRNTHRNTTWDLAKFEVAAQRYADLSDHDYGVALLNDCKYGYKVHGNLLDLNLLRSPTYPDPDADQGTHTFTYSLLPHTGDLINSGVIPEAAKLNQGLMVFDGFRTDRQRLPWRVEGEGLSLEVVKKAEKEACLILRVVETQGRTSVGRLILEDAEAVLVETNLTEWEEGLRIACKEPVEVTLEPFEIRTWKILKITNTNDQ